MNRPGHPNHLCTTPQASVVVQLMGGDASFEGVVFTRDEMRSLYRLYKFDITEEPRTYPEVAPDPGPEPLRRRSAEHDAWSKRSHEHKQTQPEAVRKRHEFEMVGAKRNCLRHARSDGLRAIGLLAKFCEPGEDPVKMLSRLMQDAGLDVPTGWEDDDGEW